MSNIDKRAPLITKGDLERIVNKLKHKADTCSHKNQYDSRDHARRVANKQEAMSGKLLYTYECKVCGHWHLSHLDPVTNRDLTK